MILIIKILGNTMPCADNGDDWLGAALNSNITQRNYERKMEKQERGRNSARHPK